MSNRNNNGMPRLPRAQAPQLASPSAKVTEKDLDQPVVDADFSPGPDAGVDEPNPHAPEMHVPSDNPNDFIPPSLMGVSDEDEYATKLPEGPIEGIPVVCTRKAFYNQMRYKEHDQLVLNSEDDLGEWHTCLDPKMEKKRVQKIKDKKARKI